MKKSESTECGEDKIFELGHKIIELLQCDVCICGLADVALGHLWSVPASECELVCVVMMAVGVGM